MNNNTQLARDILSSIRGYSADNKQDMRTPELRRIIRGYATQIRSLSFSQRKHLALTLIASSQDGAGLCANVVLAQSVNDFTPKDISWLDTYLDAFTGWGVTDDFCINILQPLLRMHTKPVLALLRTWNTSSHPWKRRASVVAFVRTIGESGQFTDECLRLCEHLLHDPERLVLQGVGWALKDSMRGDKKKVLDYVIGLRQRGISSIITLYALRDMKGKEKQDILKIKHHA